MIYLDTPQGPRQVTYEEQLKFRRTLIMRALELPENTLITRDFAEKVCVEFFGYKPLWFYGDNIVKRTFRLFKETTLQVN